MTVGPNQIVRVSARFKSTRSGDIVNVYYWLTGSAFSEADADVMTAINTKLSAMYATMASHLAEESDPYDIRYDIVQWLVDKFVVVRTLGTATWTLSNPPIGTGDSLPQMNAAILNGRTGEVGTYARKYLGPIIEGSQQYGSLVAGALTALANFGTAWAADISMASGSMTAGVASVKPGTYGYHFAVLAATVANALLGTQRRRRINRGS